MSEEPSDDPTDTPIEYEPSDALMDLVEMAMTHALDSIGEGGPLVPFVVFVAAGERKLERFLVGASDDEDSWDLGLSVEQAKQFTTTLAGKAELAAMAVDGRVRAEDGSLLDCVFVEAFEATGPCALCFGQCYQPASEGQAFALLGEGMLLDTLVPMW
ncbi:hypothetical protein ACNOYE_06030 [Nannocystaceae bacterium ST9]